MRNELLHEMSIQEIRDELKVALEMPERYSVVWLGLEYSDIYGGNPALKVSLRIGHPVYGVGGLIEVGYAERMADLAGSIKDKLNAKGGKT